MPDRGRSGTTCAGFSPALHAAGRSWLPNPLDGSSRRHRGRPAPGPSDGRDPVPVRRAPEGPRPPGRRRPATAPRSTSSSTASRTRTRGSSRIGVRPARRRPTSPSARRCSVRTRRQVAGRRHPVRPAVPVGGALDVAGRGARLRAFPARSPATWADAAVLRRGPRPGARRRRRRRRPPGSRPLWPTRARWTAWSAAGAAYAAAEFSRPDDRRADARLATEPSCRPAEPWRRSSMSDRQSRWSSAPTTRAGGTSCAAPSPRSRTSAGAGRRDRRGRRPQRDTCWPGPGGSSRCPGDVRTVAHRAWPAPATAASLAAGGDIVGVPRRRRRGRAGVAGRACWSPTPTRPWPASAARIVPAWQTARPRWWPEEFDWVVGCTYRGMPEDRATVRNLIGCNMSFRREVFERVGAFTEGIGRVGHAPRRAARRPSCASGWHSGGRRRTIVYEPAALVHHHVPADRASWSYFRRRCFAEGQSKARVTDCGRRRRCPVRRAQLRRCGRSGGGVAAGPSAHAARGDYRGARARRPSIAAGVVMAAAGYADGTAGPAGGGRRERSSGDDQHGLRRCRRRSRARCCATATP